MLGRIIAHECLLLKRDRSSWLIVALLMGSVGYSVFAGAARVQSERNGIQRFDEAHKALVERYRLRAQAIERVQAGGSSGPFNLHRNEFTWGPRQAAYVPAWAPFFGALPPASTSALAVGQDDIYPPAFVVRPYDTDDSNLAPAAEANGNPLKLLVGHFDLAFVVLYLFPLFILALTYDLLSSEREQGVLSLVLSQPVSSRAVVLGKIAARALLFFGAAAFGSIAAFVLSGVATSGPDAPVRLLLWMTATIVYGAVWFALGAWVNSWGRSSIANAVVLASFWLSFCMILPAGLQFTASALYPLPPKSQIVEAERIADQEARDRRVRLSAEEQEALMSAFLNEHPEFKKPGAWNERGRMSIFAVIGRKERHQQLDPHYRGAGKQRDRQLGLLNATRFLSPALLLQSALYEAAGSGPGRRRHFREEVVRYQGEFQRFLWPKLFTGATMSSAEFEDFPRFRYREEPLAAMASRTVAPIGTLSAMAAILGVAAWRRVRRFEVTG
jgi:ABC-2 type transport system permease protein